MPQESHTQVAMGSAVESRWTSLLSSTTLPNGISIDQINQHETDFLYAEIFEQNVYFRHDISLPPQAVVFDVGANIGLFTLAVNERCPDATVFALEPSPSAAEALRRNAKQMAAQVHVLECGASSEIGNSTLTFYPGYSILSGFHSDADRDCSVLKAGIRDQSLQSGTSQFLSETAVNWLARQKLAEPMNVVCQMRTLSSVINEHCLDHIDLLKIDAERCEEEILDGIAKQHWPLISQIVTEVHDQSGETLERIVARLKEHGFSALVEPSGEDSGLFNLTARR